MQVVLERIERLNDVVSRLHTENAVVDVLTSALDCKENDVLQIGCSAEMCKGKNTYVARGVVYHTDAHHACISMGGLLARLPIKCVPSKEVYLSIVKSRSRKRKNL